VWRHRSRQRHAHERRQCPQLTAAIAITTKRGSCLVKEVMPDARRRGRPRTTWMDNIKTWIGLPVEESIRLTRIEINGESTSMVWLTLGSRTAKQQNRLQSSCYGSVVKGRIADAVLRIMLSISTADMSGHAQVCPQKCPSLTQFLKPTLVYTTNGISICSALQRSSWIVAVLCNWPRDTPKIAHFPEGIRASVIGFPIGLS